MSLENQDIKQRKNLLRTNPTYSADISAGSIPGSRQEAA